MREPNAKEREILAEVGTDVSDFELCRRYRLRPSQLELLLVRAAKWAARSDRAESALLCERALRRRAEAARQATEAKFQALLEASPNAILVVNGITGIIVQANDRAGQLFGWTEGRLVGKSVEELVPAKYRMLHPAFRIDFVSSRRKRAMGYHPPIFAVKSDETEIEIAIALTATEKGDDVIAVCTEFARWKPLDEQGTSEADAV